MVSSCLSSFPISLLLFEASLPPLRVTLTHFTLLSYEQALRLPTSFLISGLARLGVKPRLQIILESFYVHSCLCFPPFLLGRLFLLFSLESAFLHHGVHPFLFMFPLRSPPLSHQDTALTHLGTLLLMIRYSGQMALFLFLWAKVPGRNCLLSSYSIRLQWVPSTCFSQGTTWLMSWPDGEHYLCPLQSLVVSFLLSLVFTLVFSQTGGILSHLNF